MIGRISGVLAAILAVVVLPTVAGAGETVPADQIRSVMSDSQIRGTNTYGNPYVVKFFADGRVEGVAGASNEYVDSGEWWIEDDMFCRRYEKWFNGKPGCYRLIKNGETLKWVDRGGKVVSTDVHKKLN